MSTTFVRFVQCAIYSDNIAFFVAKTDRTLEDTSRRTTENARRTHKLQHSGACLRGIEEPNCKLELDTSHKRCKSKSDTRPCLQSTWHSRATKEGFYNKQISFYVCQPNIFYGDGAQHAWSSYIFTLCSSVCFVSLSSYTSHTQFL